MDQLNLALDFGGPIAVIKLHNSIIRITFLSVKIVGVEECAWNVSQI